MRALPFAVAALLSIVVLFTPQSGVPTAPPGTDKLVHLLLFALLAGTGRVAGPRPVPLAAGLAGYAALSEVLQAVLPLGRSGDVVDLAVDLAGLLLGLGATRLLGRARRAPAAPR